jgi:hypothetical protein
MPGASWENRSAFVARGQSAIVDTGGRQDAITLADGTAWFQCIDFRVDALTLHSFENLSSTKQWDIIDTRREKAWNPEIHAQDRGTAEARYRQFRSVAEERPTRRG